MGACSSPAVSGGGLIERERGKKRLGLNIEGGAYAFPAVSGGC